MKEYKDGYLLTRKEFAEQTFNMSEDQISFNEKEGIHKYKYKTTDNKPIYIKHG